MHRARGGITGLALALTASSWCAMARADPPAPIVAPVDYNAPDPHRDILSYARAFANVTFANYLVFQINWLRGVTWIYDTRSSIGQVLQSDFQFDYDPIQVNLLEHPLQGSLDFTSARAAGLSFWESALYAPIGSMEWDLFGERQVAYPGGWRSKPSINDFLTTATAGILLGEITYRLSSELLDYTAVGTERVLREIAAAAISPMRGINRLYTGDTWQAGPPPLRTHPVLVALDAGIDRLRTDQAYTPTSLVAVELLYGDLLPTRSDAAFDPLEYFAGYVALNQANDVLSGAQVFGQGLLYGRSWALARGEDAEQSNDVAGFVQCFDFQGANITRFGTMGVGPADYVEWRFGPHRKLRIGVDLDWTYLAATTSPFTNPNKEYNFSTGGAVGLDGRLELGPFGNVSLRSRNYLLGVLDGQGQREVVGYARLAYDVHVVPHVGLGASPTFIYRSSASNGEQIGGTSLETQLYVRVDN